MPTTSSGLWLVPLSMASTFSRVGMMMGMVSVIPLSRKYCWRLSAVSVNVGAPVEGVLVPVFDSSAVSGRVSAATTSGMNGLPLTGSLPSR